MTQGQLLQDLYYKLSQHAIEVSDEPSVWTWYNYANILYLLWHSETKEEKDLMKVLIKSNVSVKAYLEACPQALNPHDANLFIDVSEIFLEDADDLQEVILKSTEFWRYYLKHTEEYQKAVANLVKHIGFQYDLDLIGKVALFIKLDKEERLLFFSEDGIDLLFYLIEELLYDNIRVFDEETFNKFLSSVSPLEIRRICQELPDDKLRIARLAKYKQHVVKKMFSTKCESDLIEVDFTRKRKKV